VQEELEQFYLAHQQAEERSNELEGQVNAGAEQLAASKEQVEQQLARIGELEQELRDRGETLAAAEAECQASGEQLQQVQEELEHYFLHSRSQAELIAELERQQQRALQLLAHTTQR